MFAKGVFGGFLRGSASELDALGLAAKRKNQPCLSGLLRAPRRISAVGPGRFIRELIPFGNTHDPSSQKFLNPWVGKPI
jgi:hypothetical protein